MNTRFVLMTTIIMLACVTQVSSDIYIPSLMSISLQLTGATFNLAQFSVVIFLYGVSLTQLIAGPLSEGIGRKIPMVIGMLIMSVGSVICAAAISIDQLILGRLIQGLGGGALAALWRAIFRDTMSGKELARYSSSISVLMVFVVSIAPALGGYFEQFGWRTSFIFMLGYTLLSLVILQFTYHETSQHHHADKLKLCYVIKVYKTLLTNRLFMGTTVCTFLTYGGLFSWIVISPSLLMHNIGLSSVAFGWTIAITGVLSYSIPALVNAKFVVRLGIPTMMRIGWGFMIVSGLFMFIGYYLVGVTLWSVIFPIVLFFSGSTLIWPNAFATAFTPFGHIAGYAGSLYGFMQLSGGALIGSFAARLPETDQRMLAVLIISTSVMALLIYQFVVVPMIDKEDP